MLVYQRVIVPILVMDMAPLKAPASSPSGSVNGSGPQLCVGGDRALGLISSRLHGEKRGDFMVISCFSSWTMENLLYLLTCLAICMEISMGFHGDFMKSRKIYSNSLGRFSWDLYGDFHGRFTNRHCMFLSDL